MSARFFGEYLVQKGVIKSEALVSALIEQMARLPLVSQIVFDNKWISADKLMKIFHLQQERGMDFTMACRELGFWDEKLSLAVDEYLNKERVPVGQILVQRGEIDIKTLTKSLDDFLAQAEVHEVSKPTTPVKAEAVAMAHEIQDLEPEDLVDAIMEEETPEDTFQPGIIAELEDMFDERKRRAVKVALGFIKDKKPPDAAMMTKLMQDSLKIISTILGLVKLFGINSLQEIFQEMERVLQIRMNAAAFSKEDMQHVAEVLSAAMEESWVLRESLSAHCTDSFYMKDPNSKARFEKMLSNLKDIE